MKKIFILFLLSIGFVSANAQTTIFIDSFPNMNNWNNTDLTGSNPTNGIWKTYGTTPYAVWFQSYSINAAQTDYVNDGLAENGALSLKTALNCATYSKVFLDFDCTFQYPTGGTTTPNTAGRGYVEISTNNTTWNTALTLSANEAIVRRLDISQWAANSATVYVRFRYQSNFSGFWILDNVKVYNPAKVNVGLVNLAGTGTERTMGGLQFISYTLVNFGSDTAKDISFEFKSSPTATPEIINYPGLNLAPLKSFATGAIGASLAWTCPDQGIFKTNLKIASVNGGANSNTTYTNQDKMAIVYGTSAANRIPLFEVFTSSTCGPCTAGNANLHSIIDTKDTNTFNVIKYQQDFPGTGDPYATVETVNRRGWYGINSIPRMEIDGEWDGNAASFDETLFTNATQAKSLFNLSGTYKLDTTAKTVAIAMDIKPLSDLFTTEFRVMYALVERITVKNKKTNGETSFTQVVKKLIPNENGTLIESISPTLMTANTTFKHNTTFTLPGVYRLPATGATANQIKLATEHSVENFNNLYVVAWVESKTEGLVLQSAKLSKLVTSTASLDSFHEKVSSIATVVDSAKAVNGTFDLLKDTTYVWNVPSATISLPSTWSFLSLCDNFNCYYAPITTQEFKGKALKADNPIKVEIKHNKKPGYGSIVVELWKKSNKAGTIKSYKFSLLTTTTASISILSDINEKLLYYFDNKIFVDNEFKNAQLQIVDINGRQIMDTKVSSDNVDFTPTSNGIFIATVIKDGQVAKTIKFSTAK